MKGLQMSLNNATTAQAPLRHVAENSGVIGEQVDGLTKRDGQGPFIATTPPSETRTEGGGGSPQE